MLGALPTQDTLILERFFDESGGMQLVLHAPFGSRVNRAWGLALRKRFCRQFNFELQAAATEDAVLLSLGPQHSFPLESVFRYLHPDTCATCWCRRCSMPPCSRPTGGGMHSIALALPRSRGGRKVPPQIQRMEAEDLLAAVFPDAAACLENIPGDREVPDHPLVRQTVDDCLHEVMDVDGLIAVLRRIHAGEIRCLARDVPEPSPLAHEILNARPYQFLDDAPLEERRAQAVYTRRAFEPSSADDLGALDPAAIQRVREEVWPEVRDADELHDALLTSGFLTDAEGSPPWARGPHESELVEAGRAARVASDPLSLGRRRSARAEVRGCLTKCSTRARTRTSRHRRSDQRGRARGDHRRGRRGEVDVGTRRRWSPRAWCSAGASVPAMPRPRPRREWCERRHWRVSIATHSIACARRSSR